MVGGNAPLGEARITATITRVLLGETKAMVTRAEEPEKAQGEQQRCMKRLRRPLPSSCSSGEGVGGRELGSSWGRGVKWEQQRGASRAGGLAVAGRGGWRR